MDWESMELQRQQNRYDPELVRCWFCRRCGNEIYSAETYEEHEGMCQYCWEENDETDQTT